jgi:hypothetical protein
MTFEIKPIDRATFEAIWTPAVAEQLDKLIYETANWIDNFDGRHWAIDEDKQACFLQVHMSNRLDPAQCYALVMRGEFALIRNVGYCTYSIAATSVGFVNRLDEVKHMVNQSLQIGGTQLDGTTEPHNTWTVPNAEFVPYVAPQGE